MDMRAINPAVIERYRFTGGQLEGEMAGLPVLLLTTTGRNSGEPHHAARLRRGCRAISSSRPRRGGWPQHPDWYRNLLADPTATVEIGAATHVAGAQFTRHRA